MHGRRTPLLLLPLLAVLPALGCDDVRAELPPARETAPSSTAAAAGSQFDANAAGTITGRVRWPGETPRVPPIRTGLAAVVTDDPHDRRDWPNPHAPLIDAETRGLRDAVVFLSGLDPARGRPWDHGPATAVQAGQQLRLRQDGTESRVGFVRTGDELTMLSGDAQFYSLHAGGAAYFTLTFPDPDRPRRRPLTLPGEVELTSSAGRPWMRAHLFVADHPYFARTDAAGRYTLPAVPAGRYDAVCWLPDWRIARHDRDPENGAIARITFAPARLQTRTVAVAPGGTVTLDWDWGSP